MINVSTWNSNMNESILDFDSYTINDAVSFAELMETVNDVEIDMEDE